MGVPLWFDCSFLGSQLVQSGSGLQDQVVAEVLAVLAVWIRKSADQHTAGGVPAALLKLLDKRRGLLLAKSHGTQHQQGAG